MKVRSSVKPICEKCKVIKRKGAIRDRADPCRSIQAASVSFPGTMLGNN